MRTYTQEQLERNRAQDAVYRKANAQKISDRRRLFRIANAEKVAARQKLYHEANKERLNKRKREYYKENIERMLQYRVENVDRIREAHIQYRKLYPHKINAWVAKRRAIKLQATPSWADLPRIAEVYELSYQRSVATGITHHVDHIVPLQGKTVCGLHVHYNLQVLTQSENCSKRNSYWPDMP